MTSLLIYFIYAAKYLQLVLTLCDPVDHGPPLLYMGFSRQEYWSGLPCPPPGDLPNPGMEPASLASLASPAFPGRFFTTSATWEAHYDQIVNIHWITEKAREVQKNTYFCFIDYANTFDHNNLWKILKEMGIPDHLTWLLRNLYASQKQQLELDMEQQTGSK